MTDPAMADATYIEPITWQTVAKIIEKERPDALLPTMGGQTALNCALDLDHNGVLKEFGVEMIGATEDAIDKAEDRSRFDKAMKAIGLECPRSAIAHNMEEASAALEELGFLGDDHDRAFLGADHFTGLVNEELHAIQLLEQIVGEFDDVSYAR